MIKLIMPTIVPIYPDEHIIGWIERLAEANNIAADMMLSHYWGIDDEVFSKQDGSLKSLAGLSRLSATDIGMSLRDIIVKHTAAVADAVFMKPFRESVYLGALCTSSSVVRKNKVLDTYLPPKRRYCPVCVQEDKANCGQVLMHSPHQSTIVNTCWKHGIRLVDDALDSKCVCSSEEDIKTARFMHGVYMHEIIADIRTVRSVVLSDKYMRKMKALMDSGQMDEVLQYAEIGSLVDYFKYLLAASTQNGVNRMKFARATAQFVDVNDLAEYTRDPSVMCEECKKILQEEGRGSRIIHTDYPIVTIHCGRCGREYTTWCQSVISGMLCPHCADFELQEDVSNKMFAVFAKHHGFRLSGKTDKKKVEAVHLCGKRLWIDPVNAISRGDLKCPECFGQEKDGLGNSKKIVLALHRIGMQKMMSCGHEATIIAYRSAKDIDIEFDDGTVRNTSFQCFIDGSVLPIDKQQYISKSHVGEKVKMRCGQTATVLSYHAGRVDIEFEDGNVRHDVLYNLFKKGVISPVSVGKKADMRIGQSRQMRNGCTVTIIRYRSYQDIDVRFENGEIREHVSCAGFDKGSLRPGAWTRWIGQRAVMNCGKEAEVVGYRNSNDIDCLFSDGSKICHATTKQFSHGTLRPPGEDWRGRLSQKKAAKYIGMRKMMNCGQEATIIDYRNADDIDIRFDDGSIRTGVTVIQYNRGAITPVHHYKYADFRIGEKRLMLCGMEAEIIAYRSAGDMDIRFSDGSVKTSCDYNRFKKGELSPVRQDRTMYGRVGEKDMMKCGLEAEIVGYRGSNDIDVEFSDGTLLTGVRYIQFVRKSLRPHRNYSAERIGEKRIMRCGPEAEIIAYRNANDMDVRFPDGTIRTGVAYHNFSNGKVSPVPRGIKK